MTDLPNANGDNSTPRALQVSGRLVVIGLLVLGTCTTTLLFMYWSQQTRHFRLLRESIGREIPHSRPILDIDQFNKSGRKSLRISISVDFPPDDTAQANLVSDKVWRMIRQQKEFDNFDVIELSLVQFVPQQAARSTKFSWTKDGTKTLVTE